MGDAAAAPPHALASAGLAGLPVRGPHPYVRPMNPLVAVTTTLVPNAGSHGRPQVALYASYLAPLDGIGLAPVLLTPAHSPASAMLNSHTRPCASATVPRPRRAASAAARVG